MASFFQPAVYDPNEASQVPTASADQSRFLIYTNSTVADTGLFATWYQYVVLGVGATFFCAPIFKWIIGGLTYSIKKKRAQRRRKLEDDLKGSSLPKAAVSTPHGFGRFPKDKAEAPVVSFGVYLGGDVNNFLNEKHDLYIIDSEIYERHMVDSGVYNGRAQTSRSFSAGPFRGPPFQQSAQPARPPNVQPVEKNIWGLIGQSRWNAILSAPSTMLYSAERLRAAISAQGMSGLVIPAGMISESQLNEILEIFAHAGLRIILLDEAHEPAKAINPDNLCGVIYKNACILDNGLRRDFFRASKLRASMARYGRARQRDPSFLVGFYDLWVERPLPSVIRRGYKFAKFHDAIFRHEAAISVRHYENPKIRGNCLSAFDWLKRDDIIKAQKTPLKVMPPVRKQSTATLWIPKPMGPDFDIAALEKFVPGITRAFTPKAVTEDLADIQEEMYEPPAYLAQAPPRPDIWTVSSQGERLCERGCYDIREEVFDDQYLAVVNSQIHLHKLGMLDPVPESQVEEICQSIANASLPASVARGLLRDLRDELTSGSIRVFRGLDSGFCLPDNRGHFWAVSNETESDGLCLYVSLKAPDLLTTVVHVYLAHRGVGRRSRFDIEVKLIPTLPSGTTLHPRLKHELETATYAELLLMLEQIAVSAMNDDVLDTVRTECERLLIDDASERSWIKLHSHGFLSKSVTIEAILRARLAFFSKRGTQYLPDLIELSLLYTRIDEAILNALYENDEEQLQILSSPLIGPESTPKTGLNESEDLYSLMFFCSLRRRAFEEVYVETTDRCPLFLQQRDQAAVFAELWVLGSQCEVYFGIKPRALGHIIYNEYREYLEENHPTPEAFNGVDVFTAYHKDTCNEDGQLSTDSEATDKTTAAMPIRVRLAKATFLTIFCVPAIVDVGLLTFLGRGLYLTAFMTLEERIMANYAVLAGLIMTAGVTGWSGSTGGFYLYQSAFHNMNHFMVQRFSGGFILATIVSVCGLIAFGLQFSWYAGFVFAAYLMALSNYLNLLGIMATMHRDGTPFESGRSVLASCLLITLISPAITSFVNGHDVAIYLSVLYLFLVVLIIRYAKLCRSWSNWTEKVHLVKEEEIVSWYQSQTTAMVNSAIEKSTVGHMPAVSQSVLASACLMEAIENTKGRKLFRSKIKNPDPFVKKLAEGHKYVVWLLEKESNGQPLPKPYSSTWLVQTKLALTNQLQLYRGLKEHSPFLLYRTSKFDLAQNVGLFLVALLDRWIAISMSANGHVVNVYYNIRARYGIAFGLLYFLLCAVSLDVVLQRYWGKTGRRSAEKLSNLLEFEATEEQESGVEKKRWLGAISELVWVMLCIFGFMTLLLWLFVNDYNQIILYFTYILGYSAVIIFQFNRVFTTDIKIHVQIVFLAAFGGYIVGIILHEIPQTQDFRFNDVVALCSASLSAALGTWLFSDFCDDPAQEVHVAAEDLVNWKVYSQKLLGKDRPHCTMRTELLEEAQGTECSFEDNSILSEGIKSVIAAGIENQAAAIRTTFPRARDVMEYTLKAWRQKQLRLIVMDRKALVASGGAEVFAASSMVDDCLMIYVGMPSIDSWRNISEDAYESLLIQISAEALLHECCEGLLHMQHADATLVELFLNGDAHISTRMAVQLAWSDHAELNSIVSNTNAELVRHLALGIEPNISWEDTSEDVRLAVVSRILRQPYLKSRSLMSFLTSKSTTIMNHDWYVKQCLAIREIAYSRLQSHEPSEIYTARPVREHVWNSKHFTRKASGIYLVERGLAKVYQTLCLVVEFIAIVSTGGNDCGRELWYVLRESRIQAPVVWIILKTWKVCWLMKTMWTRLLLLSQDEKYQQFYEWATKGASRSLVDGILTVRDPRGNRTGFLAKGPIGVEIVVFDGIHLELPRKPTNHQVATYDQSMRLMQLIDVKQTAVQVVQYNSYYFSPDDRSRKYPVSRTTQEGAESLPVYYDDFGRVTHGEYLKSGLRYQFNYVYKSRPAKSTQIIKATYTLIAAQEHIVYSVYWCRETESSGADIQTWAPTSRVRRFTKSTDRFIREILWTYEHKRDPTIVSTTFSRDYQENIEREVLEKFTDEIGILSKPSSTSYADEDILFYHSRSAVNKAASASLSSVNKKAMQNISKTPSMFQKAQKRIRSLWTKKYVSHHLLATSVIRSALWKEWVTRTDASAVTTCLLDEIILRHEPLLRRYWRLRDGGSFEKAKQYLLEHLEEVTDSIEVMDDYSQKTSLTIKTGDLLVMGFSKDSNFVTYKQEESFIDTETRVAVIFTDTGCWPDAPGGVSNCRRDLVDGHTTIRNYALTESANEYGIPRFQVERNMQMVKNMPLWGLDGKTPCHGLFDNLLQLQVEARIRRTRTREDITNTFVPLLTSIVRGSRTIRLSQRDLFDYTNVFLKLNKYFDENDYLTTWRSKAVRKAWREAWLCEYADPNISNPNDSFEIERPTASDFDEALELYISYFFIFSIRVPEKVPQVFQSTHHGISSLFGMILKLRRGTTWGIWDHAIMFRESCLNISPAQCILPVAVQSMLLGAMKLASNLAYHHADIILPCTAIYNPIWEADLGTDQGLRSSVKLFQRKIDPITNGISNMEQFKPVETTRTEDPTVVMLSNVQFIKDVKNAVYAAGVIINDFGFKNYNLVVYGAQDRQPSYAIETEELIGTLGIGKTVKLGGFGSPKEVLKDAWLFMNSSLSEGLPLAIGEAALSGIPIVATEVGATAQVLQDVDDPSILYGEVVPPNDPVSLARAQISLLAMLGQWSKYTDDEEPPPPLPTTFTSEDVEWISARMHAKTPDRRALGLRLRDVVLRKFSGERYLREHEQMYWIQRHMAEQRANTRLTHLATSHPKYGQPFSPKLVEVEDSESMWLERRWQDFSAGKENLRITWPMSTKSNVGSPKDWTPQTVEEGFPNYSPAYPRATTQKAEEGYSNYAPSHPRAIMQKADEDDSNYTPAYLRANTQKAGEDHSNYSPAHRRVSSRKVEEGFLNHSPADPRTITQTVQEGFPTYSSAHPRAVAQERFPNYSPAQPRAITQTVEQPFPNFSPTYSRAASQTVEPPFPNYSPAYSRAASRTVEQPFPNYSPAHPRATSQTVERRFPTDSPAHPRAITQSVEERLRNYSPAYARAI